LLRVSFDEFEKVWNHIILDFYPKVPIIYIEPNHVLKNNFLELLKKWLRTCIKYGLKIGLRKDGPIARSEMIQEGDTMHSSK